MTDREKLIELLKGFSFPVTVNGEPLSEWTIPVPQIRKALADHLLANGVMFATGTNDGRKWISVYDRLPEPGIRHWMEGQIFRASDDEGGII